MRRAVTGLVVLAGFAGFLGTAPAHAAEAGGARPPAAPASSTPGSGTTAVRGSCRTWSSATGSYGARCSGGGVAKSFRDLLGGAAAPTCWLLAPGSTDPTPADLTPFPGATPAPVPPPAPAPARPPAAEPTASPTATATASPSPDGTPTGTPTSVPTTAPTAAPATAPTTPATPPTDGAPGTPVTPTVPVELPVDLVKACLTPTPDPDSLAPAWDSSFVLATVPVLRSDPGRLPYWWELTAGQRRYVTFAEGSGSITEGTLLSSPSRSPASARSSRSPWTAPPAGWCPSGTCGCGPGWSRCGSTRANRGGNR